MANNVDIVVLKRQKSNESMLDFFMLSQCLYVCHNLCICIYAGLVMSHHHPDQMYQRSQVFRITLCSLNVFVFVINIRKRISFREVVKKKNGLFTVRLTVRVDPPPPLRSGCCDFFKISLHILTYFTIL